MPLEISLKNKNEFMSLFGVPVIDSYPLTPKSKVNLYVLNINAGNFDYESLIKELGNASTHYVLSRGRIKELTSIEGRAWELVTEAMNKFRDWGNNDGEGGELLLYCFLETHLGAPKLLSKMELKTAGNDYVKGSDGIHLLKINENDFQIIYGESKMYPSLSDGIRKSMESLKELKNKGFNSEVALVDSNIMKESLEVDEIEYLKAVLIPSKDTPNIITRNNAFGIFLGFEVDISNWKLQELSTEEFSSKIHESVKSMFEQQFDNIKKKINSYGLDGHHFYFYSIPFIKKVNAGLSLNQTRKNIIKSITNHGSN